MACSSAKELLISGMADGLLAFATWQRGGSELSATRHAANDNLRASTANAVKSLKSLLEMVGQELHQNIDSSDPQAPNTRAVHTG
jgi:hypothetical protein